MTSPTLSASAPRVRVSRSALEQNMRAARHEASAVDLRRDACGHGIETVARAALAAGVRSAVLDAAAAPEAERLGLVETTGRAMDPRVVFGVDGTGRLAMELTSPVLQTKRLRPGDGVSYGYRWRATRETRAALVAGGYAQGVVRALGGAITVLVGGADAPVVGRVAMDVCVVDVGDLPVEPGDEAIFFGPDAPQLLSAWERASGLDALELVAAVGLRANREEVA